MNPNALRERPDRRGRKRAERRRGAAVGGRREGPRREVTLDDKYLLEEGRDPPHRRPGARARCCSTSTAPTGARGLRTGTFVSGYQGSPLGGLDQELQRRASSAPSTTSATCPASTRSSAPPRCGAASSPAALPGSRYDGVLGIWYGKAPGLDRAADALRHANFVGVSRTGGALALVRRRPELQVLDAPERLRVAAREPPHADLLPRRRPGGARPRPARARVLARVGPVDRLQDRDERRRRRRHRRRRVPTG